MAQGALFWNDDKSRACRPGLSIHPFVRIDAWSIVPPRITISTEIGRDAFDSTNPNVLVSTSPPTAVLDMLRVETAAPGEPTWIGVSPAATVTIRAVISACTARRQAGHSAASTVRIFRTEWSARWRRLLWVGRPSQNLQYFRKWYRLPGSNGRPLDPQSSALTS